LHVGAAHFGWLRGDPFEEAFGLPVEGIV